MDIIYKAIGVLGAKTSLSKLRIHQREYQWYDYGGIISIYIPTMIYLLFKIINTSTRIGVSNLKYETDKATLAKFGNNVKYIPDYMYYNYTIIIDKGEHHEYYIRHMTSNILSWPN